MPSCFMENVFSLTPIRSKSLQFSFLCSSRNPLPWKPTLEIQELAHFPLFYIIVIHFWIVGQNKPFEDMAMSNGKFQRLNKPLKYLGGKLIDNENNCVVGWSWERFQSGGREEMLEMRRSRGEGRAEARLWTRCEAVTHSRNRLDDVSHYAC